MVIYFFSLISKILPFVCGTGSLYIVTLLLSQLTPRQALPIVGAKGRSGGLRMKSGQASLPELYGCHQRHLWGRWSFGTKNQPLAFMPQLVTTAFCSRYICYSVSSFRYFSPLTPNKFPRWKFLEWFLGYFHRTCDCPLRM